MSSNRPSPQTSKRPPSVGVAAATVATESNPKSPSPAPVGPPQQYTMGDIVSAQLPRTALTTDMSPGSREMHQSIIAQIAQSQLQYSSASATQHEATSEGRGMDVSSLSTPRKGISRVTRIATPTGIRQIVFSPLPAAAAPGHRSSQSDAVQRTGLS